MPYKGERTEVRGREEFKFSFRVIATEETAAQSPRLIQDLGQGQITVVALQSDPQAPPIWPAYSPSPRATWDLLGVDRLMKC